MLVKIVKGIRSGNIIDVMSIDEFLNQIKYLSRRSDVLLEQYNRAKIEAQGTAASSNFGMPHSRTNRNYTEERFISVVSAGEKWRTTREEYMKYYNAFERAMYDLLYWEGLVVYQAFIANPFFNNEPLSGLSHILKTNDTEEIKAKLSIAKAHLEEKLKKQGIVTE